MLLVVGCGSTVPSSGTAGAGPDGLGRTYETGQAEPAGVTEVGQAAGTGFTAPGQAGTAASPRGYGKLAPGPAARASTAAPARRADVKPIEIGLIYEEGSGSRAAALGLRGLDTGDQKQKLAAVVADVNARGGLGGHKIAPIYAPSTTGPDDSRNTATREQAVCSRLTQDHRVMAAVTITGYSELLPRCLAAKGVPLIAQSAGFSSGFFRQLRDLYFVVSDAAMDVGVASAADRLFERGFYGSNAKVGIVYDDLPDNRAAVATMVARLHAHGVQVANKFALDGGSDQEYLASFNSAVLRFRSDGITHVQFVTYSAFLFMPVAESQGYRPRYGLTSMDSPIFLAQNVPAAQLKSALLEGWRPLFDVGYADQPPRNPASARCRTLMQKHGIQDGDGTSEGYSMNSCDVLWFLERSLAPSVDDLSATVLARGVAGLGTSYRSTFTFSTYFTAQRHYGAAILRDASYVDGCSCFRYSGTSGYLRP